MGFSAESLKLQTHDTMPEGWVGTGRLAVTFEYENHGAVREAQVTAWYELGGEALDAVGLEWYLKNRCADTTAEDLAREIAALLDEVCSGGIKVVLSADVGATERVMVEMKRVVR